jgi:hypothetical protein
MDSLYFSCFERLYDEATRSGKAPWLREGAAPCAAYNPKSGVLYKGMNGVMLDMSAAVRELRDPRWIAFHEAARAGLTLRHGEQPTPVAYAHAMLSQTQYALVCNLEQFREYPRMPARNIKQEQEIGQEKRRAALEHMGAGNFAAVVHALENETAREPLVAQALARYRLAQECNECYMPPAGAERMRQERRGEKGRLPFIQAVCRAEALTKRILARGRDGRERGAVMERSPGREA